MKRIYNNNTSDNGEPTARRRQVSTYQITFYALLSSKI